MKRSFLYIGVGLGFVLAVVAVGIAVVTQNRSEDTEVFGRMQDLKGISLGIRGYMHEAEAGYFPTDIADKNGRPLLSWRVAILPHMDRQSLYEKFHLDEPWDSAHNIKLLADIPPEFRGPQASDSTATPYQMLIGPDAVFQSNQRITPGAILALAGTEYTLHVIESAEAVPWTKPVDVAYSNDAPLPKFGYFSPPTFLAIMASGSIFEIDPERDGQQVIRNAIAPHGDGERVVNPRRASFSVITEKEMHFQDNWK